MISERPPRDAKLENVQLVALNGQTQPATVCFKRWTSSESFKKGFQRAGKWVALILLVPLPLAIVEPFLFIVWGGLYFFGVLFFVGPCLHAKFWNEQESFFYAEGICPACNTHTKLTPYLSTAYLQTFKVHCPQCGQTSKGTRQMT